VNRVYAAAAALLVGLSFWAGREWRDRSADLAQSRQATKQAQAETKAVETARSAEHQQADTLATIGETHEQARAAAPAVADAVVADLRAGNLRLRDGWASCETQRMSDASAAARERDAAAQRRAEFAGAVVRAGRDADDQLAACQAVIRAYVAQ
jgi:hypothetical protein